MTETKTIMTVDMPQMKVHSSGENGVNDDLETKHASSRKKVLPKQNLARDVLLEHAAIRILHRISVRRKTFSR